MSASRSPHRTCRPCRLVSGSADSVTPRPAAAALSRRHDTTRSLQAHHHHHHHQQQQQHDINSTITNNNNSNNGNYRKHTLNANPAGPCHVSAAYLLNSRLNGTVSEITLKNQTALKGNPSCSAVLFKVLKFLALGSESSLCYTILLLILLLQLLLLLLLLLILLMRVLHILIFNFGCFTHNCTEYRQESYVFKHRKIGRILGFIPVKPYDIEQK